MKKYNYCALIFLIAYASLHAVNDVCIERFDTDKHGKKAQAVFQESFPGIIFHSSVFFPKDPKDNLQAHVIVPYDDSEQNPDSRDVDVRGFITYSTLELPLSEALPDIYNKKKAKKELYKLQPTLDFETATHIKMLDYLAVDSQYRKNGYGKILLSHVEHVDKNCDFISLTSLTEAIPFYKKNGYMHTDPFEKATLTKPLNDNARSLLSAVCTVRNKTASEDDEIII